MIQVFDAIHGVGRDGAYPELQTISHVDPTNVTASHVELPVFMFASVMPSQAAEGGQDDALHIPVVHWGGGGEV